MVQNANLKGVHVSHCLMATDTKENLDFFILQWVIIMIYNKLKL